MWVLVIIFVIIIFVVVGWGLVKAAETDLIKCDHERLKELGKLETAGLLTTEEKAEAMELIKRLREYNKKCANPVDRRIMEHEEKKEWEQTKIRIKENLPSFIASLEVKEVEGKNLEEEFKNMCELMEKRPLTKDEAIHCLVVITQLKELSMKYMDEEEKKRIEEVIKTLAKSLNLNKAGVLVDEEVATK